MSYLKPVATLLIVTIVALYTHDVIAQVNAGIDPCDPLTIYTNCMALIYNCVDDCTSNNSGAGYSDACVQACGNETDVCQSVTDGNCFDSKDCQAKGLCVSSDAPVFTEPCNPATIALPCNFKLNDCAADTSNTVATCTDELNACVAKGTEGCGLNGNGGFGGGGGNAFANGGTNTNGGLNGNGGFGNGGGNFFGNGGTNGSGDLNGNNGSGNAVNAFFGSGGPGTVPLFTMFAIQLLTVSWLIISKT